MEDIKRLVRIISKRKQRQFPLLELKSINENSSKENIFFRYIKKDIVHTDDDASKLIYGTKSDDDRFRMLKSRLKQKLLNHMFFLDFTENNYKSANQYEQECIQQLHQAKMLMFTGESKVAKSMVLKALTTSERCEFTKHIISSLEDLVKIYSDNCQPHLFDDVIARLNAARELYIHEIKAREHYYYIKMMVVKSVNSRKKNLDNAEQSIQELEKIWNATKSYNVFEYFLKLSLLHKELTGDYTGIISLLHEVETGKFQGYTLNKYRVDQKMIILSTSFSYFRAWEFEQGIKYIERNLEFFDNASTAWFDVSRIYILMSIYSRKYKKALEIINSVFENRVYDKLSKAEKDTWNLYNDYLQVIYMENFHMKNADFINSMMKMPDYHKDSEGFNVAIIILQFLYFTEVNDLNELEKRRDELKMYMANHFKENFSYRSRTIYKLLNIAVENKLDIRPIQIKSRYLIKKLRSNRIMGNAYQEMEIVPYEHLWDLIIKMIRTNDQRSL